MMYLPSKQSGRIYQDWSEQTHFGLVEPVVWLNKKQAIYLIISPIPKWSVRMRLPWDIVCSSDRLACECFPLDSGLLFLPLTFLTACLAFLWLTSESHLTAKDRKSNRNWTCQAWLRAHAVTLAISIFLWIPKPSCCHFQKRNDTVRSTCGTTANYISLVHEQPTAALQRTRSRSPPSRAFAEAYKGRRMNKIRTERIERNHSVELKCMQSMECIECIWCMWVRITLSCLSSQPCFPHVHHIHSDSVHYASLFRSCLALAMAPRPTLAEQAAICLPARAWLPGTPPDIWQGEFAVTSNFGRHLGSELLRTNACG